MQETKSKKVLKSYYLGCALVYILYLAIIVPLIIVFHNIWSVLLGILLWFATVIAVRIIAGKTIYSVLYVDFEPQEFMKIIDSRFFIPSISSQFDAAYCSGDFQTTINILERYKQKKISKMQKLWVLSSLSYVYFEMRDMENLRKIYDQHIEFLNDYPRLANQKKDYSLWNYYEAFLKSDYNSCIAICKKRDLVRNEKVSISKIRKINDKFYLAVAHYENGDTEEASELFAHIIKYAPKFHIAETAQMYIDAISENSQPKFPEMSSFSVKTELFDKNIVDKDLRLGVFRRLLIVLLILCIAMTVIGYTGKAIKKYKIDIEYKNKLEAGLSNKYDSFDIVEYFSLEKGEKFITDICVVSEIEGRCDVGFVVTYDQGTTFAFIIGIDDIIAEEYYYVREPVNNRCIGLKMYTDKSAISKDYYKIVAMEHNNSKAWIVFDYIE